MSRWAAVEYFVLNMIIFNKPLYLNHSANATMPRIEEIDKFIAYGFLFEANQSERAILYNLLSIYTK